MRVRSPLRAPDHARGQLAGRALRSKRRSGWFDSTVRVQIPHPWGMPSGKGRRWAPEAVGEAWGRAARWAASIRGRCTGLLNRGTRFDSEVAYQSYGAQALGLMHRVLNPGNLDRPQGASPMEGQADGRRQRSRKPPSDEPWRSDSSSFRHSISRMESLADQRRQLVANQWSRTPRDLQVQILRSPPSAPSRPATVFASSRPRDPGRARTPWGFGPEQVVFYGRGRLGRRWFPKPVQMGSIPVVRAILALSNGNDAVLPRRRCGSDSRRGVHLSGSSNGRMPVYGTGDDGSNPSLEANCRGSPIGRAPASEAGGWWFEPTPRRHAAAARSDEHPGPNGKGAGSIPACGSICRGSSIGRAAGFYPDGWRFEPSLRRHPIHPNP